MRLALVVVGCQPAARPIAQPVTPPVVAPVVAAPDDCAPDHHALERLAADHRPSRLDEAPPVTPA